MARQHPFAQDRPHHIREEGGALAAGAQLALGPAQRTWFEFISVRIRLTTDATVTNRRMVIVFGGIADDDYLVAAPMQQIATRTYDYYFGIGVGIQGVTINDTIANLSLPIGLRLGYPEQLRTEIINFQAGDQIMMSNIRYRSWIDPVALA